MKKKFSADKPLIIIIHESVSDDATPSEKDVKMEAESVCLALEKKGYQAKQMVYDSKNAQKTIEEIKKLSPLVVFNLVETIEKSSELCYKVAEELEKNGLTYTGCSAFSLQKTTDKLSAKEVLEKHDIKVPEYFDLNGNGNFVAGRTYIIKPVCEEGSEGITSKSIVSAKTAGELSEKIKTHSNEVGFRCFAEEYIDGKEYAVSLVGPTLKMKVFLPARMDFSGFSEKNFSGTPEKTLGRSDKKFSSETQKQVSSKPVKSFSFEILDYDAKWKADSFAYNFSSRRFDVDRETIKKITKISKQCVKAFKLGGYVRIDLRMDKQGELYVIDINGNPCVSRDSGFIAAASIGGFEYEEIIDHIVKCALL